jgi:hypothetical protein
VRFLVDGKNSVEKIFLWQPVLREGNTSDAIVDF